MPRLVERRLRSSEGLPSRSSSAVEGRIEGRLLFRGPSPGVDVVVGVVGVPSLAARPQNLLQ